MACLDLQYGSVAFQPVTIRDLPHCSACCDAGRYSDAEKLAAIKKVLERADDIDNTHRPGGAA